MNTELHFICRILIPRSWLISSPSLVAQQSKQLQRIHHHGVSHLVNPCYQFNMHVRMCPSTVTSLVSSTVVRCILFCCWSLHPWSVNRFCGVGHQCVVKRPGVGHQCVVKRHPCCCPGFQWIQELCFECLIIVLWCLKVYQTLWNSQYWTLVGNLRFYFDITMTLTFIVIQISFRIMIFLIVSI